MSHLDESPLDAVQPILADESASEGQAEPKRQPWGRRGLLLLLGNLGLGAALMLLSHPGKHLRSQELEAVDLVLLPSRLLQCPKTPAKKTEFMTLEGYDQISASVVSQLERLPKNCNAMDCPQADFAGCVLRMAGHDFMDYKDGEGGSDACTDMSNPDNNGLVACLSTGERYNGVTVSLQGAYEKHCADLSLADFLVIAAEAIMTHRMEGQSSKFRANFRYGRETNDKNCSWAEGRLPNPEKGCDDVDRVFVKNMGLSKREAAALSGVHTLGRARKENSGYDGWWSDPENSRTFNNDYFVSMVAKGWMPVKKFGGHPNKNFWTRSDVGRSFMNHEMMLSSDICLAYKEDGEFLDAKEHNCCAWLNPPFISKKDGKSLGISKEAVRNNEKGQLCGHRLIEPGEGSRALCCDTSPHPHTEDDCGNSDFLAGYAHKDVMEFAEDQDKWLEVFYKAWTKATELGTKGLKKPEGMDARDSGRRRRRSGGGHGRRRKGGGGRDGGDGRPPRPHHEPDWHSDKYRDDHPEYWRRPRRGH